jgi:MFS family permease
MRELPPHINAVMEALKFCSPRRDGLRSMTDAEWKDFFSQWGFLRLTLPLQHICGDDLPLWVREQIDQSTANNTERFSRIKKDYAEIAGALSDAGVEHLVLKGFAQWPAYMQSPRFRVQSDLDLFCPSESIFRARDVLHTLGYLSAQGKEHQATEHLADLKRESNWQWRGKLFDPEMPLSVDLHFCFWDKDFTRLDPHGLDKFWQRRVERQLDDLRFPALDQVDSLAYCALHILRNVLTDGLLAYQVYELAWFLHTSADDASFWEQWSASHDDSLRSLEAVCFRLARDWFSCRLPQEAEREIEFLPTPVQRWFNDHGKSPLADMISPNKDALWLHLGLLSSASDKRLVFCRRIFPVQIPPAKAVRDWPLRIYGTFALHVISRVTHHLRLLPPTLWQGLCWWWSGKGLGKRFWTFYAASFCFDFGMFIFFFLFNLYLLDCGYTEKFIGQVTSANAVGSIAGTIPAGLMAQRFGLQKTMMACFAMLALFSGMRAMFVSRVPQLGLSFAAGAMATTFAVCISPALAQLTNEQNRAFGFSIVFSFGIGDGILGSFFGGHLPGWLARIHPAATPVDLKRSALLIACGITALAVWPTSRLRFARTPDSEKRSYRLNPFLLRFLPAIALWSLVTGAFSPFASVYFAQHLRMPVERIGMVFSASQLSQVIAILAAPFIFRKFGLVTGIMYTQIATAVALGCLSLAPGAASAGLVYVGFMAFQWMGEPGMYSLLMSEVTPAGRTGASALNFLVISAAQAVAALVAGMGLARFGYPVVMGMTACVAFVTAILFRLFLGNGFSAGSYRAPMRIAGSDPEPIS